MASKSKRLAYFKKPSILLLILWSGFVLWMKNSINLLFSYECPRLPGSKKATPYLNVYEWTFENCLPLSIVAIKGNSRFPHAPHKNYTINVVNFDALKESISFGRIIFGHIQPTVTGFYRLSIISNDVSELWLSPDEEPKNSKLVCVVTAKEAGVYTRHGYYQKVKSTSKLVYLENYRRYFMEIIYAHDSNPSHFRLVWQLPGASNFTDIPSHVFNGDIRNYPAPKMNHHHIKHSNKHSSHFYERIPIRKQNIEYKHHLDTDLPLCDKPKPRFYQLLTGVYHVHIAKVYPEDGSASTIGKTCVGEKRPELCKGNSLIKKTKVKDVVKKYMASLVPWNLTLTKVIYMEEFDTKDSDHKIYYVDLQVKNVSTFEPMRISDVFWLNKTTRRLCNPREWEYRDDTMVYAIVTTKNQGLWLHRFVDNLEYIQEQNKDYNIHPIIVDFGDEYLPINDTIGYLEQSKLRQYTVIPRNGRFNKTAAINEAADSVSEAFSIIFQLDLHLDMPVDLFDIVRKHTILSRSAFSPMLFRLRCGYLADNPVGRWEHRGHGLFAIYKKDWEKFGGMNVKEFGTKWGGEDWEMIDRVLANGFDVQTIRLPGLYHFYHSRRKMWEKSN